MSPFASTEADAANPPEFFLDGPAPDGAAVLRRAVRSVRRQAGRSARIRFGLLAGGALLAAVALTGTGVAVGIGAQPAPVGKASILATEPTGSASVRVVLTAYDGGSRVTATAAGLPIGAACQLVLIARDGARVPIGGWRIGADWAGWSLHESAWLSPDRVAAVEVLVGNGVELTGAAH